MEWIGLKKSEYLSELIQNMDPDDVPFEEFFKYDGLIEETIRNPDETFESVEDGHELRVFVRFHSSLQNIHQVVIGLLFPDEKKGAQVLVPVMTFVTKKEKLLRLFTSGTPVHKHTLN